jgi:hypothetical protein
VASVNNWRSPIAMHYRAAGDPNFEDARVLVAMVSRLRRLKRMAPQAFDDDPEFRLQALRYLRQTAPVGQIKAMAEVGTRTDVRALLPLDPGAHPGPVTAVATSSPASPTRSIWPSTSGG